MHPVLLRYSSLEYNKVFALLAPCRTGASAPSVLEGISETPHCIYFVALGRSPQRIVNYAYVALPSRASCLQASPPFRYDPCEKFGLILDFGRAGTYILDRKIKKGGTNRMLETSVLYTTMIVVGILVWTFLIPHLKISFLPVRIKDRFKRR
jgi:hypothetical protein